MRLAPMKSSLDAYFSENPKDERKTGDLVMGEHRNASLNPYRCSEIKMPREPLEVLEA